MQRIKSLSSSRVLVVEDDESVALGLQWSLEEEGIAVRVVTKGAEVSRAVTEFRPDVIVLDLKLPDDDGGDVYRRLATKSPVPVIFSSGHALESEIETLLDLPRAAFLMKPYSIQDLLRTIHEVVDSKTFADDVAFEAGGEVPIARCFRRGC